MAPKAAAAACVGASSIAGPCTNCWKPGLCRPRGGPAYTNELLNAMISVGSTLASGAGNAPVGAAAAEEAERGPKAPAACDSPSSHSAQAPSAAAGTDAADEFSGKAEAAQPGCMPGDSAASAAASSAGPMPDAGSGRAAAGQSLEGQMSLSHASTGGAEAEGSPPVATAASDSVAERSTAHEAPPDRIPGLSEGAIERWKWREITEGGSRTVSLKPLTPQQHAVVAALMVVMKRAMLEGHEASSAARERLLCNNPQTLVVLENIGGRRFPRIRHVERMLQMEGQDLVDLLAMQCAAADLQPLHVFTRSVQCGVIAAYKDAHRRGEAAGLARHQQLAELDRAFVEHCLSDTRLPITINHLVRQGVPKGNAKLLVSLRVMAMELCRQCFRPSDASQAGAFHYAALDHLFPGDCQFHITMYRHAAMVAGITSAITHLSLPS